MKKTWSEMSTRIEKQEKLINEIILKMAQEKSKNRLSRLIKFEVLGICWALAANLFIVLHFNSFKDSLSIAGAILSVIILVVGIIVGVDFIKKARRIKISKNYKQPLIDFISWKKSYHFNKVLGYGLGSVILITIAPVVFRINRNLEITEVPIADLLTYAIFGGIASFGLSFLLFKFFYEKQIKEIDRILTDIKEC